MSPGVFHTLFATPSSLVYDVTDSDTDGSLCKMAAPAVVFTLLSYIYIYNASF